MVDKTHVVILGTGPAGLGAAYRLAKRGLAGVTVLERQTAVGGNAGSFELAGQRVDYGSHRLHPACDPAILNDIRSLLGADLLDRPRHGRIRLQKRWLHFPLQPLDLATHLPPGIALGAAADAARRALGRRAAVGEESFATVLEAGLGATICREFYFPYATKLWGLAPEQLSATQAARRVSAGSPARMLRKVSSAVPGLKPAGAGRFYYPRRGFGQIAQAYYAAARAAGAEFHLGASVKAIALRDGGGGTVSYTVDGTECSIEADHVWSTIPVTSLARLLRPAPPSDLLPSDAVLDFRAMILIYLILEQDRYTEYDAHYFPEPDIAISRLSEPKNYGGEEEPHGTTVLCAELPCSPADPPWPMADDELGRLAGDALAVAGIPIRAPVRDVVTRRLRQAYPIYRRGYEETFARLDGWLGGIDGLLTFGRQGLFAHDNTHHALYMGYCAADCLGDDGRFDRERWQVFRQEFGKHVVED
jgi:protoporphyrinogen oxidase